MAKYLDAKCKICRREGKKMFLKGEKCYTAKCPIIKRKYPPGLHGPKGYPKLSTYGIQLREKQKLKRTYGILEKQLKIYYRKALRMAGNTEENLLKLLERRIDNVVYKAGFSSSINQARQIVNHRHLVVNGRPVNIPSYLVRPNEEIALKMNSSLREKIKTEIAKAKERGRIRPEWFFVDEEKLTIKILRKPEAEDLPKDFDMRAIIEFYSR
ncbi:MAG: 30S ribosomal protein S4 [Patescibacteria group bacterium]|nr:30S ribosomal protein S4 [Patescibacteria group bacterium]